MTDTVFVCPYCDDSSDIHKRVDPTDDPPYYCGHCGSDFDQPAERERYVGKRKADTLPTGLDPAMKDRIKSIRGDE